MLWLWWFNRGGAIHSHGLNFIGDFHVFVALLAILQRFGPENWGQDTTFRLHENNTINISLLGIPLNNDGTRPTINITVDDPSPRHLALNLFTHASCIVPVKCSTNFEDYFGTTVGKEYVAKISFPNEVRSNEAMLLTYAYQIARENNDDGAAIRGHIPTLLAERTWVDPSADLIESILKIERKGSKKLYRLLRVLLYPVLYPISRLSGLQYIQAFRDCFICE